MSTARPFLLKLSRDLASECPFVGGAWALCRKEKDICSAFWTENTLSVSSRPKLKSLHRLSVHPHPTLGAGSTRASDSNSRANKVLPEGSQKALAQLGMGAMAPAATNMPEECQIEAPALTPEQLKATFEAHASSLATTSAVGPRKPTAACANRDSSAPSSYHSIGQHVGQVQCKAPQEHRRLTSAAAFQADLQGPGRLRRRPARWPAEKRACKAVATPWL